MLDVFWHSSIFIVQKSLNELMLIITLHRIVDGLS